MIPDPLRRFVPLNRAAEWSGSRGSAKLLANDEELLPCAAALVARLQSLDLSVKTARIVSEFEHSLPEEPQTLTLGPLIFVSWRQSQAFLDTDREELMIFAGSEATNREDWTTALASLIEDATSGDNLVTSTAPRRDNCTVPAS